MRRIAPEDYRKFVCGIENDKFFAGDWESKKLPPKRLRVSLDKNSPSYQLTMAYLKVLINTWMKDYTNRVQFSSVKKEKFTIKDVYNNFDTCL
jgi:hypothetical protein